LVVVDDFGWSDVGFHGSKIETPNMDKFLDYYYDTPAIDLFSNEKSSSLRQISNTHRCALKALLYTLNLLSL